MNATKSPAQKVPLTAEQRQQRYAAALEDTMHEVHGRYERLKREFEKAVAKSGYDYAACWHLEAVVMAEYQVRYMAAVIHMLKLLTEGQHDRATIRDQMIQYRDELTHQLVQARPWEHHCTCAITNVTCLWQATARAQSVEMIDKILRYDLKD